jgi:hypothetical protein
MQRLYQVIAVFLIPAYLALSPSPVIRMSEICDNALDDDGDGLIDLNDPDCDCPVAEPVSLIPNPSFEERSCCPQTRGSLHCADTWIQASEATTDYLHTCGFNGWPDLPIPQPIPDGEACIGFRNGRFGEGNSNPNWKEYTGACLTSPLRAGTTYLFQFWLGFTHYQNSPPLNVVFYGSTDCKNLPFGSGNERHGCPLNGEGWIPLDVIYASGANIWKKQQFSVTPDQDIYAIAIGPDCLELDLTDNPYYFLDHLVLADVKEFDLVIAPTAHPCDPGFGLRLPERAGFQYQWYRNGVALVGETGHELKTLREGTYQVRVLEDHGTTSCKITKPYTHTIPVIRTSESRHVCEGEFITVRGRSVSNSGVFIDTLQTRNLCDSIVETTVRMISDSAVHVHARIFEGETYRVGHRQFRQPVNETVLLTSSLGCDSTVQLELEYYKVFIPNALTPNADGVNDGFSVYGSTDLISIKSLVLFNRWGGKIFEGNDLPPNESIPLWLDNRAGDGVHTYLVSLLMDDGQLHQLSGSVLMLR